MSNYSSIAKDITAGVLSAMLSFGAVDYSKTGARYGGMPHAETSMSARSESPYTMQPSDSGAARSQKFTLNYGNDLMGWLDDIGHGGNSYLRNIFNSNAPDDMKYMFAMAFYDGISGRGGENHNNGSKMMYLEPYKDADGSFGYIDRREGRVIAMAKRMSNGLFGYYGPEDYITKLFGRGELSVLADRTADGDYWNKG